MQRRNTKQKQMVLDAVSNRSDHPSAEQIYLEIHKRDKSVSKGTVYRNLAVLSLEKQIRCLRFPDACRYDWVTSDHNHFVCSICGKVYDSDLTYDVNLDNKVMENGFYVMTHETVFRGLCPECNKKKS